MKIELTNYEIHTKALSFDCLKNSPEYFPAKIIFYIQKNINLFNQLDMAIVAAKDSIIEHYGIVNSDQGLTIPQDKLPIANQELNELMFLKQELDISLIPLSWIEDMKFTPEQMSVLAFMIDENK